MPDLYFFAGINGAGKSTLYSNELDENDDLSHSKRINADEIAKKNYWDWRKPGTDIRAMKIELNQIAKCIENKLSFNLETTLAGSPKYFDKLIQKARNQGFNIHMYYA